MKEIINMDGAIKKADEKMTFVSNDKDALRLYHMREMALSDYNSGINNAKREGKRENTIEIAKNVLKENLPPELISKLTGLDITAIKKLASEEK